VALDASPVTFGDLVLGQGSQEAGCRPLLLVGAGGDLGSDLLDHRQAQVVEDEAEALGVDRLDHAATPVSRSS
jgi:hypothetical protein